MKGIVAPACLRAGRPATRLPSHDAAREAWNVAGLSDPAGVAAVPIRRRPHDTGMPPPPRQGTPHPMRDAGLALRYRQRAVACWW